MNRKRESFFGTIVGCFCRVASTCIFVALCTYLPVAFTKPSSETNAKSCKARIFDDNILLTQKLEFIFNSSTNNAIPPSNMTPLDVNVALLTNVGNKGSGIFYAGAFFLAIDDLNNIAVRDGIPVKFSWIFRDTDNRQTTAMSKMADLYCAQKVSAFIGPDAFCKPCSLMATSFHLPYITYNCEENHSGNDSHLMVNAEPSFGYVSRFIVAVLHHYRWKSFWLVTGLSIKWQNVAQQLKVNAEMMNISINGETEDEANDAFSAFYASSNNYRNILQASRHRTRVYVFLGDYESLLMFLRDMKTLGMTDTGEYAVVAPDDSNANTSGEGIYLTTIDRRLKKLSDPEKIERLSAYKNVLVVKPQKQDINKREFEDLVFNKNVLPPINLKTLPPGSLYKRPDIPSQAYHLYDATMFYGTAVMDLMAIPGADPENASQIIYYLRCSYHDSIQGNKVWIHSNGESQESYMVVDLVFDNGDILKPRLREAGIFSSPNDDELVYTPLHPVQWVSGYPPISDPPCGFDGKLCRSSKLADWKVAIIIATVLIFVLIGVVILILGIRHYMYEQKLERLAWKIEREEIQILNPGQFRELTTPSRPRKKDSYSGSQLMSSFLTVQDPDPDIITDGNYNSEIIPVGVYRGTNVAVRKLTRKNLELTRALKKQLQLRKELSHENINRFIGACIEIPHIYMVTQYCPRKSLQDILRNDDSPLDDMFITSLVQDTIRGMHFIHESEIGFHGNLKSSNCLVDSRWTVKITDFGLSAIGPPPSSTVEDEEYFRGLLWTAPELLPQRRRRYSGANNHAHPYYHGSLSNNNNNNSNNRNFILANQKGDIYSFAIILYELYGRSGPWGHSKMTNKEIIDGLLNRVTPVLRPDISTLTCNVNMVSMIQDCWDEDPNFRPDFKYGIRTRFKPIQQGYLKSNIFDNMLAMMEKYANNLEAVVAERTEQLRQEKRMTENLLLRMLPRSVAEKLKRGHRVQPEQFEQVSIYFSDIVGFTELSADSTPMEVVDLLNDLYTCFDSIIEEFDVYKVETIGDAYMVVSGLPIRNGDRHAGEIASMSLLILEAIKQKRFRIRGRSDYMVKIRIGIHSGPCCAGVVGLKMPRYCLFGDTVNTANRFESTGEPLKIHCSVDCKNILDKLGGYTLEERGLIEMKGKGTLLTYFLNSEDHHHRYKRMSSYKKMNNNGRRASLSNINYTNKLYSLGGKGFTHTHLQPDRNSLLSKNSFAKDFNQFSTLKKTKDIAWPKIPEEIPQPHSYPEKSPVIIKMSPVALDKSCNVESMPDTVSYSTSYENNMSETRPLLGEYKISDIEPINCTSSSNQNSKLLLPPLLKTRSWDTLQEDKNKHGIVTYRVNMNEAVRPETVM